MGGSQRAIRPAGGVATCVRRNSLREKIARGDPALGSFLSLGSPAVAELFGHAGFEWLAIEMEHNGIDMAGVEQMLSAIDSTGAIPLVRVPSSAPLTIQRALDIGALGIIVPQIRTRAEAEAVVRATRFPPSGTRSFGPVRAARYGLDNEDYFTQANTRIFVGLILETKEALEALDQIAGVDGVDALYVGPFDLCISLGLNPFADGFAALEPLILDSLATCQGQGVGFGLPVRTTSELRLRLKQGFTFMGFGPDYMLLADVVRDAQAEFLDKDG